MLDLVLVLLFFSRIGIPMIWCFLVSVCIENFFSGTDSAVKRPPISSPAASSEPINTSPISMYDLQQPLTPHNIVCLYHRLHRPRFMSYVCPRDMRNCI
uniref:Uncharacterized protein n=1 Tax=Anguilla anguilla TaxID=7936 RepID=A0A0E9X491_ANGAN